MAFTAIFDACVLYPASLRDFLIRLAMTDLFFNDLCRRVASGIVVRGIMGHATEAMTEHYSFVSPSEKLAASRSVLRLVTDAARAEQGEQKGEPADRAAEGSPDSSGVPGGADRI